MERKSEKEGESCEDGTSGIDDLSCEHLYNYKKVKGLENYKNIHSAFVTCSTTMELSRKYHLCYCYICKTRHQRLHACLICAFFGCYEKNHIQQHSTELGHCLAVDITTGNIYCFACKDYVYDHKFEELSRRQKKCEGRYVASWFPTETVRLVTENCQLLEHSKETSNVANQPPQSKKKNEHSKETSNVANQPPQSKKKNEQNKVAVAGISSNKTPKSKKKSGYQNSACNTESSPLNQIPKHFQNTFGLRGLSSLGQTCYLNSILQVLTHIPVLRNIFLSFDHNSKACKFEIDEKVHCIVHEMISLTQGFYSGKTVPMPPERICYLVMNKYISIYVAENKVQKREAIKMAHDVHEMLTVIFEILHDDMKNADEKDDNCNCCVHRLFTGVFEQDICCEVCGTKRTKLEDFNILSFGILSETGKPLPGLSLMECLEKYIAPELVDLQCDKCGESVKKKKTMKLLIAPIVMCFNFKRRVYNGTKDIIIKEFVSFPEFLDITPYSCVAPSCESSTKNVGISKNRYSLIGVICHTPDQAKKSGHYISFIKEHGNWYECDDYNVYRVDKDDVLSSQAYVLFYQKEQLKYGLKKK